VKFGEGDGRIGMLALIPNGPQETFDVEKFGSLLVDSLPAYAVPRFLRLKTEFETTPTFKIKKNLLRDEGFDPGIVSDPLFVILPGDDTFQPLTDDLFAEITDGKYRF
jgi:hypothetical protein